MKTRRAPLQILNLEDRTVPAAYTFAAGTLTVNLNTNNESITVAPAAGSTYTFTGSVAPTGSVGGAGSLVGNVATISNPAAVTSIQITDSATGTVVNFNGANSFGTNLTAAADQITFGPGATLATTASAALTSGSTLILPDRVNVAGNFSASAPNGISQLGPIVVGQNVAFTNAGGAGTSIVLQDQQNSVLGTVSFNQSAGTVANLFWTNTSSIAQAPTLTLPNLTTYILEHTNTGVVLPATTLAGGASSLQVTAFGDLTQAGAIVANSGFFSVAGNASITLTNAGNNLADVSFSAAMSTQTVAYADATTFNLSSTDLGRAGLTLTALTGNITQSGAVTQLPSGGPISVTATAGTAIDLSQANTLTGPVTLQGANVVGVSIRNLNPLASYDQYTLPAGTAITQTIQHDNAPVILPSLTLGALQANGTSVGQKPGTNLTITGSAIFNVSAGALTLDATTNDFNTLTIGSSSRFDVIVRDANDLSLNQSNVGSGRLTIAVGGNLTQTGFLRQAAGTVTTDRVALSSTGGAITLNNAQNRFRGPLDVAASAQAVQVTNSLATILGDVVAGSFTLAGTSVAQDPGRALTISGATTVSGSTVSLGNAANAFGGAVSLTTTGASELRTAGALQLGASTFGGNQSIFANGAVAQAGPLNAGAVTTFIDAGSNAITLTDAANNFGTFAATTTGNLSVTDTNAIALGELRLGGGTLIVTAGNTVTQSGRLLQTAPGAITIASTNATAANRNVSLGNTANEFLGTFRTTNANNLTVNNRGDLIFDDTSVQTGNLVLVAGKTVDLPNANLNIGSLNVSGNRILVGADINSTSTINTFGRLEFTGNRQISFASSGATLSGDLTTTGNLTFNVNGGSGLTYQNGTWDQGANALSITGANGSLLLSNATIPTRFRIGAGGTIAATGITVANGTTFQAGTNDALAESIAINAGAGGFNMDGELQVGFGLTNDRIVVSGTGGLDLTGSLRGSSLAGAVATPVVQVSGGTLTGLFLNTLDPITTAPIPFFAGSDIVQADYTSPTQVSVARGGTEDSDGIVTGFQPDGDGYRVKTTLGGAGKLVVIEDLNGRVNAVVRNNSAASTLSIDATSFLGNGVIEVAGLSVNGPGSTTIAAPTSTFTNGDVLIQNELKSLTALDLSNQDIRAGGATTSKTTVKVREVIATSIDIGGVLDSFTARQVTSTKPFVAERFGIVKTTGDATIANPGNFNATLVSRAAPSVTPNVGTVTIAGTLSGTWDVGGGVGTVTATSVNAWNLGAALDGTNGGASLGNPDGLTSVAALKFGAANALNINAVGKVAAITSGNLIGASKLRAGSFGTISVTDNLTTVERGNADLRLTALGNAGGTTKLALDKLAVSDNFPAAGTNVLEFRDGNVNSISAGRLLSISAEAFNTANGGRIGAIKGGAISNSTILAKSVGSIAAVGNDPAGQFGDISSVSVTTNGVGPGTTALGIGTISATRSINSLTANVRKGNMTSASASLAILGATVALHDPAAGSLGTLSAASLGTTNVSARTVGKVSTAAAKLVRPNSLIDVGNATGVRVNAYLFAGTAPGLGTLAIVGDLGNSSILAPNGITSVTVSRSIGTTVEIVADRFQAGAEIVGSIGTLAAGNIQNAVLKATSLGTIRVTGYNLPDQTSTNVARINGNVTSSQLLATGTRLGLGVKSVTIDQGTASSDINAPFGIGTVTAGGGLSSTRLIADNATSKVGAITSSDMSGVTIRGGSLGAIKILASSRFGLKGLIGSAEFTGRNPTAPLGVASIAVAAGASNVSVETPMGVGPITVGQRLQTWRLGTGAGLASLKAADIFGSTFVARNIGSITTTGFAAIDSVGHIANSYFSVFGNSANVGVGSFNLRGKLDTSVIDVANGDVTSFTAAGMWNSTLQVGARFTKGNSVDTAVIFDAPTRKLSTFKLTSVFAGTGASVQDQFDSAAFRDSYVTAGQLGSVSITGAATDTAFGDTETHGIAFNNAGANGTVTLAGSVVSNNTTVPVANFRKAGN